MSKEAETITVYEAEHFNSLPKETQKMIKSLSDDFTIKQLNVFNPLVEAMATIEGFVDLSYKTDDKECIEQYKGAKKYVGSFNATTRDTKSKLKKPLLETGKKLDTIERVFLSRAKEVMESVDEEFKPYLDEKAEKERLALEKKNKASTDKIAELSEQQVEQTLIISRSKMFNMYVARNQKMLDGVLQYVDNYSEEALSAELVKLNESELVIPSEDLDVLLVDQVENIQVSYDKMKETSVRMIKMRIAEIQEEVKKRNTIMDVPVGGHPLPPPEAFVVPSVEDPQSFGRSFMDIMGKAINQIGLLPTITDREEIAKNSVIGGLQGYSLKILNYIDDEGNED